MPADAATPDERTAMRRALEAAEEAAQRGDVPVGAVVLHGGEIVAVGANRRELDADPTAHAEIVAIRAASFARGSWRLEDTTLVVTLEPCAMCAGAILSARIGRVVIGAMDEKAGAVGSRYNLLSDPRLNHEAEVVTGVLAEESSALLRSFFEARRS